MTNSWLEVVIEDTSLRSMATINSWTCQAPASQVTGFAKSPNGGLYAASSNLGKIFVLGPGLQNEGSYESDVFDAKILRLGAR